MKKVYQLLSLCCCLLVEQALSQDTSRLFFTTGVGIIKAPGKLGRVIEPSIAFNSGIELTSKKNWFAQVSLDFNTLKYNQQVKADGSPFLFQETAGSLFMVGINGGKNFFSRDFKWLFSLYGGGGYLNKGEPRLYMQHDDIITQKIVRKGSGFGKAGFRIGYPSPVKFLQRIYIDASWFKSPARIQGYGLNGFSFFIGSRMSM